MWNYITFFTVLYLKLLCVLVLLIGVVTLVTETYQKIKTRRERRIERLRFEQQRDTHDLFQQFLTELRRLVLLIVRTELVIRLIPFESEEALEEVKELKPLDRHAGGLISELQNEMSALSEGELLSAMNACLGEMEHECRMLQLDRGCMLPSQLLFRLAKLTGEIRRHRRQDASIEWQRQCVDIALSRIRGANSTVEIPLKKFEERIRGVSESRPQDSDGGVLES